MLSDENMSQCGEWLLLGEIGRGAYGVVYLGIGPDSKNAAVKVCQRTDLQGEHYERELRGARLYRAIPPQEGLVRMRELVEEDWGFYAVMDLADNEFAAVSAEYRPKTLASVIESEKALPLSVCVKLGIALTKGLAALQRHHLLHRDIKPGNVIYVDGHPVLSDPGLVVEESKAASLVGTPGYVPPENFIGAAGDIYSLGLTLKAASFGRNIEDLDKGPALEADTGAKLFPVWWRILNKATDPTPSRRYQSAKALLKDLENLQRKIALTPIIGSRVAKVLTPVSALAAIAVIVSIVITNRRAKHDLVRQSAETQLLKDDLAKQSAENKSLKDNLAKQSEEIKSLKSDLVRQPAENKSLRDALARQSEESKTLKEALDRQSEESKTLKDDLVKQSEENKSLKDDLAKQSAEIKSLKSDLVRQPDESKTLKEALDRQSEENKALRDALARQSEENKELKDGLARQSAEIKSLKNSLVQQPMGSKVQDVDRRQAEHDAAKEFEKDIEFFRKENQQMLKEIRETFGDRRKKELPSKDKETRDKTPGDKK